MFSFSSRRRTARLIAFALVAGALQMLAGQTRSPRGAVTDQAGEPLNGAIVKIKNTRSLHIRSYITQSNGKYRFHGLHPDIDYEVKANYRGQTGRPRTLHSYDSRREARLDLKVTVERDALPNSGVKSKQLHKRHDRKEQ
jgi:hypothetical protein